MNYATCYPGVKGAQLCNEVGLREVAWHREVKGRGVICDVSMVHCDCENGGSWAGRRTLPLQAGADPRPAPMRLWEWLRARETDDPMGALYVDPTNRERISAVDRARIDAANQKPAVKVSGGFSSAAPRQPPAEARKHYQDRDDEPDEWRGSCED